MPTLLEVMQSRLGIQEVPGKGNNPVIIGWFKAVGHPEIRDDETSWCSICCGSAALEAGLPIPPVNINMMARSWLTWGIAVDLDDVEPGDVAVWPRNNSTWQGHVNVVEKVDGDFVSCIGGNQSGLKGGDAVTRARPRHKSEALGFRRGVPATVHDLRNAGSTEIKKGDTVQNSGTIGLIATATVATVKEMLGPVDVPQFATTKESLDFWQAIIGGFNAVWKLISANPWLAGAVIVALGLVLVGRKLKTDRVAKHAAGIPISAEVAKLEAANAAG